MKRILLCLLAALLALASAAPVLAEEDEDFSIFDTMEDEVILDDEEAEAAEAAIYEPDGSILLTMTFTGDFTIGRNDQSRTDLFGRELQEQGGDINFTMQNTRDILMADDMTLPTIYSTFHNSTSRAWMSKAEREARASGRGGRVSFGGGGGFSGGGFGGGVR